MARISFRKGIFQKRVKIRKVNLFLVAKNRGIKKFSRFGGIPHRPSPPSHAYGCGGVQTTEGEHTCAGGSDPLHPSPLGGPGGGPPIGGPKK